jgi:hypothetical protein
MARNDKVPVRSPEEESAKLFPGRDTDISVDMTDAVNPPRVYEQRVPRRDASGFPPATKYVHRDGSGFPPAIGKRKSK